MGKPEIICNVCREIIIEYYNDHYKGIRGRCTRCEVDFPLE